MLSAADGERAVHLARIAIERSLDVGRPRGLPAPEEDTLPRVFGEPRGVFVTLKHYPDGELRGCIGYPLPLLALGEAIRDVALAAATEDPRFPPVEREEMDHLAVEVSVLTLPQTLTSGTPETLVGEIRPGRDGLIVEGRGRNGLLLPQVATEQGWDAEQLLEGTCEKAGLPPNAWRDRRVRIRRFEAEVFAEQRPNGPVAREPTGLTPPVARAAH
jgi:uncharacterized protein